MNTINIHGRLTRDVDITHTNAAEPLAVSKFTVAVERSYRKNGEKQVDFLNCVSFGKQADTIYKYFKKGDGITVQGEMQNNRYQNKDGDMRDKWEIKVDKFDFELTKKADAGEGQNTGDSVDGFYPVDDSAANENEPF